MYKEILVLVWMLFRRFVFYSYLASLYFQVILLLLQVQWHDRFFILLQLQLNLKNQLYQFLVDLKVSSIA